LRDAKENATELLNLHIDLKGEDTKRNRFIADMYRNEINELDELMGEMVSFRPF